MKAPSPDRLVRDLGRRIAEFRLERGLTQEELAERVDLSTRYVQAIEAGRENPTVRTLLAIAAVLRVTIASLFEQPRSRAVRKGRPPRRGT